MASKGEKLTLLERARQARRRDESTSMWDSPKIGRVRAARWYGLTSEEFAKEVTSDDPIAIDCCKYTVEWKDADVNALKDEVKYVKKKHIPAWLEQTYRDDRRAHARLKVIHKFQRLLLRTPFNPDKFAMMNNYFGLSDVVSYHVTTLTGACGKFISKDSTSVMFVCVRTYSPGTVSTVVRHDFKTALTVAYLFSDEDISMHHILLEIPVQFRTLTHPLLVPIMVGLQMLEEATFDLEHVDEMLTEIEDGTGFHNYDMARSDISLLNRLGDCRALSRDLGKTASKYALLRSRIFAIRAMQVFLSGELNSYRSWIPEEKWGDYTESNTALIERVTYMGNHIEHLLFCRGIEMRLQVQQSVIFNLIAQEDNSTTIQLSDEMRRIAIKTKRDGSIMKTIAFLGALFVPATFVSTLFSMPLFNWSAPTTNEIITNHFWIYGAVTGPLTILTIAIVGYWILSRTQKNLEDTYPSSDKSSAESQPSRFDHLKETLKFRKRQPLKTEDGV